MIQLTKEEIDAIEADALKQYPVQMDSVTINSQKISYDYYEEIREAYIAGATSEALKYKKIIEGMKATANLTSTINHIDKPKNE